MVFAVDAWNSYIVIGGMEGDRARFVCTLSTDKSRTGDEFAILFKNMLDLRGVDGREIDGAIISCVVPSLTGPLKQAVHLVTGRQPLVVGPGIKTGLNILLDNPGQMGSDLVCCAVAALHYYPVPCVTVDMGTAMIMGVLDGRKNYVGGAICPGLPISLDALTSQTSQLPNVSLEPPKKVIGHSTVECMQSGMLYGFASMLEGMLDRFEAELGETPTVVLTGQYAGTVAGLCRRRDIVCDDRLILKGLSLVYEKNARK